MERWEYALRVQVSGDIGGIIFVVVVLSALLGGSYWLVAFVVNRLLLRTLSEREKRDHILMKIVRYSIAVFAVFAGFLLVLELIGEPTILYEGFRRWM